MKSMSTVLNNCPRVLVVSHTVFSSNGNMGKTMMDLLSCIPPKKLAQIYFHSEVPTQMNCERYFRITDLDILKSVFSRKPRFTIYEKEDIKTDRIDSRTDSGISAKLYQHARKRTPLIYLMRNIMWSVGKWQSNELNRWIKEFDPELIFFATSDYSFAYKIVCRLSDQYNVPIVMWCSDDYYISRRNSNSLLYNYIYANRIKWARKTAARSCHMITISDKMQNDYAMLFQIPITTLHISAHENRYKLAPTQRKGIVYTGNLGINRVDSLLEVGMALKKANISDYGCIDVYSAEKNPKTLDRLTIENGIRFHGAVGKEKLEEILGHAKFVLYTEAFDEDSKVRTRYSLSTKVAEYLQSGACILAYGPNDISAIEYLSENNVAVILKEAENAPDIILWMLGAYKEYEQMQLNAMKLAENEHDRLKNERKIIDILLQAKRGKITDGQWKVCR